jgi:mono/diheme cytochrome c family protein
MSLKRWLLLTALLAGCGDGSGSGPENGLEELTVYPVVWNKKLATVGKIAAVADDNNSAIVFGEYGATAFENGEIESLDGSQLAWRGAARIPASDHTGTWLVGISTDGLLFRAQSHFSLDNISGRYGLEDAKVLFTAAIDAETAAFGLEKSIAIADGKTVRQVETKPFSSLAGTKGRVAVAGSGQVQVLDIAGEMLTSFDLPDAAYVAFDPKGKLLAATTTALYQETGANELSPIYEPASESIHGLVACGSRVWLATGAELGVVEDGAVLRTNGLALADDGELVPSSTSDVWVVAGGDLQRFSAEASQGDGAAEWDKDIGPIMSRSCGQCHLPNGPAGIDLSTYQNWISHRAAINQRVVVEHSMPPPGSDFSDADRKTIETWIAGGS